MPNATIKQLCICQICICGEHKCNPDDPYEICSLRKNNTVSTGVGDYVIGKDITEAERIARREKCRKQWQISPEALKSIANSYPKVANPSASSVASREGRGGASHRNQAVNSRNSVNKNNNSLHNSRKLPPIERTVENQNTEISHIVRSESQGRSVSNKLDQTKEVSKINYTREGAESSCSQIMESHRESGGSHIDVSVREDQSISCEPEWIVPRPTKVKPTDNLKLEGQMDLETTFRSTIDSSAAQRLVFSRQEGVHDRSVSPWGEADWDPTVPYKRRHRPKTSLKPGGEGYYSTNNKESYKNFIVVDQSREQMVQERLDALARSMDKKASISKRVIEPLQPKNKASNSSYTHETNGRDSTSQTKSRSKRAAEHSTTKLLTSETNKIKTNNSKVKASHEHHESNSNRLETKETTITKSKSIHNIDVSDKVEENRRNGSINGTDSMTKSSETEKNNHQPSKKGNQGDNSGRSNLPDKSVTEKHSSEGKNDKVVNGIRNDETKEKTDKNAKEKRETISNQSDGRGSHNKSPIPAKSGGTVPFAVPIVRPSPIRPTSSLTLNGKFKADSQGVANSETVHVNGSSEVTDSNRNNANATLTNGNQSTSRKDHYTVYEESLKVERDRLKASKSIPSLDKIDQSKEANADNEDKNKYRRGRSLPRNKPAKNRNESHLRFSGDMEFETTTQHFFQDGSQITEYIRESRSTDQRKPHRDLFRTSSEAELVTFKATTSTSANMSTKNNKTTAKTTYNSVFRNKLYCPAVDLSPKNPEYQYKGEAGGHHFFLPVTQY
ncbi:uncharacterized protein LOC107362671 isoform X2 [Tetranychus urticae]|uniref:uncharacterized protein LOC107362671 isoform X2 n=1 Tax=Tetranychus urticae TaxID=32264 RepID=UPI00077BB4D0|nr:uncharacterized protein LOC107362671 isoform X2 [Tetranychus urticae]